MAGVHEQALRLLDQAIERGNSCTTSSSAMVRSSNRCAAARSSHGSWRSRRSRKRSSRRDGTRPTRSRARRPLSRRARAWRRRHGDVYLAHNIRHRHRDQTRCRRMCRSAPYWWRGSAQAPMLRQRTPSPRGGQASVPPECTRRAALRHVRPGPGERHLEFVTNERARSRGSRTARAPASGEAQPTPSDRGSDIPPELRAARPADRGAPASTGPSVCMSSASAPSGAALPCSEARSLRRGSRQPLASRSGYPARSSCVHSEGY
jgi:hypothetical protein